MKIKKKCDSGPLTNGASFSFFNPLTVYSNIKAMTELTWDYNYVPGSVPNRELECKCGVPECRGRLL